MVAVMNETPDNHARHPRAARVQPDRRSPPHTPLWAYMFVIIVIVLILLLVVLFLTRGLPGPSRHTSAETYVSSVAHPMHVSSAICDLVTDASPCSATSTAPSRMIPLATTPDRGDAQ